MDSRKKKLLRNELLLPEEAGFLEAEGIEKTRNFTQRAIKANVDITSQRKIFDLSLPDWGPYAANYSPNGRHLLIGGRKGHVAAFDWKSGKLSCEIQLRETVRDVHWLHNETMFAVAQKKYVYLYDSKGLEVKCMKNHIEVNRMEFLRYHFLLATVGNAGWLKYQDTSTGDIVAELRTKQGSCNVMTLNPQNAIVLLGHSKGTVTMWSPNMATPLVKMLCHKAPLKAIAVNPSGHYLATAGLDGMMKIWDVRTYKMLHEYQTNAPVDCMTISQLDLLAVGYGPHVHIWKDAFKEKQKAPYMTHLAASQTVVDMEFCPFDDVLGIGTDSGFSSLLVPGSGEPNFDSFEANPFQTKKQRQEAEVKTLLEKIQPEMITLNPNFIGMVDRAPKEIIAEERQKEWEAANPGKPFVPKKRTRGKLSSTRKYLNKQKNIIDPKRIALRERLEKEKQDRERKRKAATEPEEKPEPAALDRFKRKKIA